MHWILQSNLIADDTLAQIEASLHASRTPHTLVRLVPFFHVLANDIETPRGPIFVYGSTGIGAVAKARGWRPGYIDDNLDYALMLQQYGELALNAGAQCAPLSDIHPAHEHFFVRPVLDSKAFAGTVMTRPEFEAFRAGVARISGDSDATLSLSDRVVIAPLNHILAEYRMFVIGGKLVTGSRYKIDHRVVPSPRVPAQIITFAQRCIDRWAPNSAFSLDIADTPAGPKVIEINAASSSGLYACDLPALVAAINTRLS